MSMELLDAKDFVDTTEASDMTRVEKDKYLDKMVSQAAILLSPTQWRELKQYIKQVNQ